MRTQNDVGTTVVADIERLTGGEWRMTQPILVTFTLDDETNRIREVEVNGT